MILPINPFYLEQGGLVAVVMAELILLQFAGYDNACKQLNGESFASS